ncbi:hypothetical protein [Dysosmobacter sp. Sow4_B12]|uniref:hypothetical protein n=1 Tax=Dysosmobacter sp. Sow4_B12 TaxID=3438777 RepID=UPI003F930000
MAGGKASALAIPFAVAVDKANLANVCQGLFLKTTTQKWRTKLTHQIAGFEKMM